MRTSIESKDIPFTFLGFLCIQTQHKITWVDADICVCVFVLVFVSFLPRFLLRFLAWYLFSVHRCYLYFCLHVGREKKVFSAALLHDFLQTGLIYGQLGTCEWKNEFRQLMEFNFIGTIVNTKILKNSSILI